MDFMTILITAVGIMILLFIPGLALTFAFFPQRKSLGLVERTGLSFVLGLAPQFLLYFMEKNFFVPINFQTSLFTIIMISLVGVVMWKIRKDRE